MKNKKYLIAVILICALAAVLAVGGFFALGGEEDAAPAPSSSAASIAAVQPSAEEASPSATENTAAAAPSDAPAVPEATAQTAALGDVQPPQEITSADTPSAETPSEEKTALRCTMSVSCASVFGNMDKLDGAKTEIIPPDGVIYAEKTLEFSEGETVFDLLLRETRANKIHLEYSETPAYNSSYIEGIGNLYEFDCGSLSGWLYRVNGEFPGYACSQYVLKNGDKIEWLYTCDLGRDVGAEGVKQQ